MPATLGPGEPGTVNESSLGLSRPEVVKSVKKNARPSRPAIAIDDSVISAVEGFSRQQLPSTVQIPPGARSFLSQRRHGMKNSDCCTDDVTSEAIVIAVFNEYCCAVLMLTDRPGIGKMHPSDV